MILVIDNYDSFTYNLVQAIGVGSVDIKVVRNDEVTIEQLKALKLSKIVISPGPGRPTDAGISKDVIHAFCEFIPILGVCLGHQVIAEAFGATVTYAKDIMHGKVSEIHHNNDGIYNGLPNPFNATRYHSLVVTKENFPKKELSITSKLKDGTIMGIQHKQFPVMGIQFHPESILTDNGQQLIQNFCNLAH